MKRKCLALFLCSILIGSISVGCGLAVGAQAKPINSTKLVKNSSEVTETENLDSGYTEGLNQFAYHIFSELTQEDNVFISPYSISMALSMLYNGADDTTRQEIAKMLGFDQFSDYTEDYSDAANESMNSNSKYIIDRLKAVDPKIQINIANSIWLADQVEFNDTIDQALLAPVRNYYSADIFRVDFTKDKTLELVNKWVSNNTDGMIDPFIEAFGDKDYLRLFLANAICFNGEWSYPFSPEDTRQQPFYGSASKQTVDMMYLFHSDFRYYSDKGIKAVEIPYGDGSLVMDVFLPEDTENSTIAKVYDKLSDEEISGFIKQLDQTQLQEVATLALPKFELEYGLVSLNDTLEKLGMNAAFDPEEADFNLIGDNLYVGEVCHKAKIQVEEWGTKAAAATGIEVETTAEVMIDEPLEFIADVPFVFMIRDKDSNMILFMGEVNQLD